MTTIKQRKNYIVNGQRLFIEQYQDKEMRVPLWRYGGMYDETHGNILKDGLRSRPDIKRIFG